MPEKALGKVFGLLATPLHSVWRPRGSGHPGLLPRACRRARRAVGMSRHTSRYTNRAIGAEEAREKLLAMLEARGGK